MSARKKSRDQRPGSTPSTPSPDQVKGQLEDAAEQLEQLQSQLEHADRLASLGTLAATIAHEFNNLLTPGINWAQLALRAFEAGTPDLELAKKALEKCHSAGQKAGRICESILNLARVPQARADSSASCEVAAVVEEALGALARDPARDGIILRMEVEPGLRAAIDPLQLEHVIVNLLLNAKHAMAGTRGSLSILASTQAAEGGQWANLEITDTGRGIDPVDLPRIFESFYTTRGGAGPVRGSGLGLSLCRKIVERNAGQITATSKRGRGTTFHIRLPLGSAAAGPTSLAA